MTDQQTTRLSLADAARAASLHEIQAAKQYRAEARKRYAEEAVDSARRVVAQKLGDEYADGVEWAADVGDDREPSSSWKSATATIDGLEFRATERYYSAGDWGSGYERTLYLRQPCPNNAHPPARRELEIDGLSGLGAILTNPGNWEGSWRCFACHWQRDPENPENQRDQDAPAPPSPPPTVEERLVGVLRELVDGIVTERLNGFLTTYLPDRV